MTSASTATATIPTSRQAADVSTRDEAIERAVAAHRARFEAGTVDGLWPETDAEDDEPTEDPAADTLDWATR